MILTQCGFAAEVERPFTTPRGDIVLDVYASENVKGRHYAIVCECKYWKAAVPQTVIHAFRTVVSETGANIGYIVSLNGFQSGSRAAAALTNIKLVTWVEFQELFEESWLECYFTQAITIRLDALISFTEPLVQPWMCEIPEAEMGIVEALRDKYWGLGRLAMLCTPYSTLALSKKLKKGVHRFPELPLRNSSILCPGSTDNLPADILDATGYLELLISMLFHGERAIDEFRAIKARNRKDGFPDV